MIPKIKIIRNEVWLADLNPVIGHEQGGKRPVLIVSVDEFNNSSAEMVTILPITSKDKGINTHVQIKLKVTSFIKVEDIRTISTRRLIKKIDTVDYATMLEVEKIINYLLGLK
jgi:mRNA interferase MazF